ncbi:PRC-barrel domain-containing protein [Solimicrobium silvestre]|uniref:PRC-barrel domain-containing protein n=1 Tax=Solimicrobium silvestre TaxID=2099400 RepID=A0A2S9GTM4_9BURK|nr:PRC-barrel domain-containing protein [Solimicrobium silvestre]PRC91065.1 hypothetical protein S2091_4253 [Solimicrobium silvestre]
MLRSLIDLNEYAIHATDGNIGHVKDFYFDDEGWAIRYFIVDTGSWLLSRKVLISPIAIGKPNWAEKTLPVLITKEQVKNSPDIDTEKPVSRQHENHYLGYYGYPIYWGGAGLWGAGIYPDMMMPGYLGDNTSTNTLPQEAVINGSRPEEVERHQNSGSHLRSCKAVIGYHIHASDGDIGHVSGMLVDDETWAIRYFIVDTSNWWLGHQVLIAPLWVEEVRWLDRTVTVNLTRQEVKDAAPYDIAVELGREQEVDIHQHYGRAGYWEHEESNKDVELYD